MCKPLLIAALLTTIPLSMTLAQTAPATPVGAPAAVPAAPAPAAAAAAPAAPAAASDLTKDGKPRMKVVREQCRDEIKTQGLKGDARRDAMEACMVKERPDKAAQIKCQMDPALKGMAKDARHAAVKDCVAKAKG